jgi:hypothetical protein
MSYALALSPAGHLFLEPDDQAEPRLSPVTSERLEAAFGNSVATGLELLAGELLHAPLPSTLVFWRGLARRYFTALCHHPNGADASATALKRPSAEVWQTMMEAAPPMKGLEYLDTPALDGCWDELDRFARERIATTAGGVQAYLKGLNPVWNVVGRVTFHLAENKRNSDYPFAFLATYTHRVSEQGKPQHLPLGRALEEYAGARNQRGPGESVGPGSARCGEEQPGADVTGYAGHVSSPGMAAQPGSRVPATDPVVRREWPHRPNP